MFVRWVDLAGYLSPPYIPLIQMYNRGFARVRLCGVIRFAEIAMLR